MAEKPQSASDYLLAAQRKAKSGVKAPAAVDTSKIVPFGKSSKSAPQDPLSWLVDIATRGLSGTTNAISGMVDRSIAGQKAAEKGDILGVAGGALGAALNPLLGAGDFLSGAFSPDPEQHRTTSDLIEQTTDKFGKNYDPNYKDEQDNVNPILKGVAGFAGDVALDPLTWIPGAQFVKAGSLIARGAKTGVAAGKGAVDAVRGIKAGEEVADAAAIASKEAAQIARPTAVDATEAGVAKIDRTVEDKLPGIENVFGKPKEVPGETALARDARLANKAIGYAGQSSKGKALRSALDEFASPLTIAAKTRTVGGVTAKSAKPIPLRTMAEVRGPDGVPITGWIEQVAAAPVESLARFGSNAPKVLQLAQVAASGNAGAIKQMEKLYTATYLPAFQSAKAASKIIDATMREVAPTAGRKITEPTQVLDSISNWRMNVEKNKTRMVEQLGAPVFEALSKYDNSANFDKVVSRMAGILDSSVDVTGLRRLDPPDRTMLDYLGVDSSSIPLRVKLQSTAHTEPIPQKMADILQKIRGEGDTNEVVTLAETTMNKTIFSQLDKSHLAEAYPFQSTTKGVKRTDAEMGAGWGRIHNEANQFFQYTAAASLMQDVVAFVKRTLPEVKAGAALADAKRSAFLPALRLMERAWDERGVPLVFGAEDGTRIPMSLSQSLDVLDNIDGQAMRYLAYNYETAVPWTNLMDAVHVAAKNGPREQIEAMLRQESTRWTKAELPNNLVKGGRYGRKAIKGKLVTQSISGEELVAKLTDMIDQGRGEFYRVMQENVEALQRRGVEETMTISDNVISALEMMKATPGATGQLLSAIADTTPRVNQLAAEFGAMKSSKSMADEIVQGTIPLTDQITAKGSTKVVGILENSVAHEEAQSLAVAVAQKQYDDFLDAQAFVPGGATRDLGERISVDLGNAIASKVMPIFSRAAGVPTELAKRWRISDNVLRTLSSHYHLRLSALARSGASVEDLAIQLKNARNGVPTTDVNTLEMRDLWGQMFGVGDRQGSLIDNAFFRNNTAIHHMNTMFEKDGLGDFIFNVDKAEQVAKAEGITVMQAAARQTAEWDIKDPLDTMSKMYHSFVTTQTHMSLAQQFQRLAKDLGATSSVPKQGYSSIVNDTGNSIFSKYLPAEMYYRDDVLQGMHVIDNMTQQTMELSGPLGNFIREVYQPLQQAWKYGMTLPNPTHHVRNLVSDYSLTYYANGLKGAKRANTAAFQAMAAHDGYDGWSAVKALQAAGEGGSVVLPDAGHIVAKGKRPGFELTSDGLYAAMSQRGNLMTFQHLEQLNEAAGGQGTGKLAQLWDSVQQSKVAEKIGGVSEARDHFARLQHAAQYIIQNIDSPRYKTLDALLDDTSDQVRKWHPDGTDMTRAEQYFRLVIPFYSWQRKAIPLIVESMLTKPGRVMSIPKAQYNFAVSMGLNPDSLSDPFPQDQLFPGYLTEQISGPVAEIDGKYWGINPGFAANDVLNDWVGANPLRSALGSTSPLIRAPFELAAGGQVGTGARINDYSDYIDSQVPGVGQVSRMTGNSVTGSLVSLLQGKGLDPQLQIAKGNKDPVQGPAVSALNWLTGAGITPMSQQNQINQAEIEKRNREGDKSGGSF